jgi:hypothetical protein
MLSSIVGQLCKRKAGIPESVVALYDKCAKGEKPARDVDDLIHLLLDVAGLFSRTFIILDALDECSERGTLLNTISRLVNDMNNLCLLTTSREEHDIKERFLKLPFQHVRIQDPQVHSDVRLYVVEKMEKDQFLQNLSPELKTKIQAALIDGAKGLYVRFLLSFYFTLFYYLICFLPPHFVPAGKYNRIISLPADGNGPVLLLYYITGYYTLVDNHRLTIHPVY